ncbi:MAG: TonB-dependent receptor [Halieaceae bacterium]|nr:TonB-dependent receptor [Halieaceae bacterium]
MLEEIVVTAEFRDTPLMQQAASTSIVSSDDIYDRAAQHLEEVLNLAPNVNYASGASRARFYQVRGIGERSQFVEPLNPSVGVLVDGIDFSGLGTAGTLFDVSQVEVLRGPQGTLHGANALAGLINITTAAPTDTPYFAVEASAAEYDTYSVGVVGSGPLVADELLYRLAVNHYESDGFIDNTFLDRDDTNNRDETVIRGKLRWLAGNSDTVDMVLSYSDIDNGYDAFSLDNTRETLSDEPGKDTLESTAVGLQWTRELTAAALHVQGSFASTETEYSYDEDWSFVGIAPELEYSSFDQYLRDRESASAEARLVSRQPLQLAGLSSDWAIGAYYLGDREDLTRNYTFLGAPFSSEFDTDTAAIFGQLDTQLSEHWVLVSGLRVERRNTDYSDSNDVSSDPSKTLWGGKLALEYYTDEGGLWYGSISRGYRANGVNAGILATEEAVEDPDQKEQLRALREFDDESLINYEIGFKRQFSDLNLGTRIALFYMDRSDQQVSSSLVLPRPDGSTNFIDYTSNAAEGSNYGLELELTWQPTANLDVYASLGLLETEFEDYINANGTDLSGRDQAHAPSYQYALGGRYDFAGGFFARVDLEGKDEFFFSDRHDVKSPSQDLVHARLGWENAHWSVALWGRNLTDEDYFARGFGSFGNDPRKGYITEPYFQYGDPRQVGVSASYRF